MARGKDTGEVLVKVSFPLYCLRLLSGRYLVVAGGGGAAKTGIKNGFEVIELLYDGQQTVGESITQYETGSSAVMNCTSFLSGKDLIFAAGLDENLQLYDLRSMIDPGKENGYILSEKEKKGSTRKRKSSRRGSGEGHSQPKPEGDNRNSSIAFKVNPVKHIQSDYSEKEEPFQKVVRACESQQLVVTGGVDGHIRVWRYPNLDKIHNISAHKKEIDDIDIAPNGNRMISISKDGLALVWNIKDGKQIANLEWSSPEKGVRYMYKRCRFGVIERDKNRYKLYTIHNPLASSKKPAYLVRWDTSKYIPERSLAQSGCLSALAVSDDGRFLATGSMDTGSINIFISFSLQKLKTVERAHATFVTGLEFLPSDDAASDVTGNSDCSVVSISVDNIVKIHHIPKRGYISAWAAALLVLTAMFFAFMLCAALGL